MLVALFLLIFSSFAEAQIDSVKLGALASVKLLIKEKKYQEARTAYLELANRGVIDQATAYTRVGDLYMKTAKFDIVLNIVFFRSLPKMKSTVFH